MLDLVNEMGLLRAALATFPIEQNLKLTLTDEEILKDSS